MRRHLVIAVWSIAALALTMALLVGAVLVAGNMAAGRALIEALTLRLSAGHVEAKGLAGNLPGHLTLDELVLSDTHGVWLTAAGIDVRWNPAALLEWRVQVENLTAARVEMRRLPVPQGRSRVKPRLPHIDVAHWQLDRVELGPELAGMPATLAGTGDYRLRSIDEMGGNVSARRKDAAGQYELHWRIDPKRADATLVLHEPAAGPLQNILRLPGLGAWSATLQLHGPRRAALLEAELDAGTLKARVAGTLDFAKQSAELTYSLDAGALQPRADLSWRRLSLAGHWRGDLSAPRVDGRWQAEELALPGRVQIAALTGTLATPGAALELKMLASGLQVPGPNRSLLAAAPLRVDASMRLTDPDRPVELKAVHPLLSLRARVLTAGDWRATFDAELTDLAPVARLAGQNLAGTARLRGAVQSARGARHLTLDADVRLTAAATGWHAALGDRAALQLAGAWSDAGVDLEHLRLDSAVGALSASGSAVRAGPADPFRELQLRWDVHIKDLAALYAPLSGRLAAAGELHGPPAALVGSVQATGRIEEAPLRIEARFARGPGGALRAELRQADWKSAHLRGDFSTAAGLSAPRGRASLRIEQLADLSHLFGLGLQGSLDGSLQMTEQARHTQVRLLLRADQLVAGALAGRLELSGEGPLDQLNLKLSAQGEAPAPAQTSAALTVGALLNLETRTLSLASGIIEYRGEKASLRSRAELSFADGWRVHRLRLGAERALLDVDGRLSPVLDLRATLRNLDASQLKVLWPQWPLRGTIGAQAELAGALDAPSGRIGLDAADLRFTDADVSGLPGIAVHAEANLHGDAAELTGRMTAGRQADISIAGSVPLRAAGVFDLALSGPLDLGLASPLVEARGQQLSGGLRLDATVQGSAQAPQLGGTVHVLNARWRDYAHGADVAGIAGEIVGSEGALKINRLTGKAGPGLVSMTGTIGLLQPGVPLDVALKASNAEPIASGIVTANMDADLRAQGRVLERMDVTGSVVLHRTTIRIPSTLPPDVAVLDVRRRGQAPPPVAGRRVVGLDIAIQAPRDLRVQGRGLDAELGGEVHLGGTAAEPLVSGGFELQRGNFSIAGNILEFTAGRVSFEGAGLRKRIDPTLDFTAETSLADVTATLHITGLADAPRFEFSSSPTLPQDEIMARLFFGENAAQMSALQAAQIGTALASLSGVGDSSGLNPIARLQKTLRLDRLTVASNNNAGVGPATGANSGTSIAAGRYVSRHVYVEAKQSTTGSSQVQVDVDLTKHLKLQTRLGNSAATTQGTTPENDPGSSVGLSYQFDY